MRMRKSGVAGIAVLATLCALLLGGCQLREGPSSEYGSLSGVPAKTVTAQNGTEKN
jgi:hypothetical protein